MEVISIVFLLSLGSSYVSPVASSCPSVPSITPALNVVAHCPDNQENCTVLTDALEQLTSATVVRLGYGTHRITRYVPIHSLQDIFILGSGKSEVTVTCDNGVGLSFVNVSDLTMCGFTIDACGLKKESISVVKQQLEKVISLWFGIPSNIGYAVVLGNCWNIHLSHVLITNTKGMGLLGINVLGNSTLHKVSFTFNIRVNCLSISPRYPFSANNNTYEQIGGGAYFLYQDVLEETEYEENPSFVLAISDSNFSHNAECSYSAITQVNFQWYPLFGQNLYQVGAGGGLSIFMAQKMFNVHTSVENSTFTENDARYGAGAHVAIFAGVDLSNVTFHGCTFEQNGAVSLARTDAMEPMSTGGAGLAIFTDLISPNNLNEPLPIPKSSVSVIVTITDTNFLSNRAVVEGGGLLVYSLFNAPHRVFGQTEPGFYTLTLTLQNCIFWNNSAQYGAAMYLQQNAHEGFSGSLLLTLSNIAVNESRASMDLDAVLLQKVKRITSAVALLNIYVQVRGKVALRDNQVTAMLLQSTPVLVTQGAQLLLERNSGQQGGAIHIKGEGAGITFDVNTVLSFLNNSASIYGGAMYISQSVISNDVLQPIDSATGCFISPLSYEDCLLEHCLINALENVSIQFQGNTAPRGSIMFGSTLESCTWTTLFPKLHVSVYQILHIFIDAVEFDVAPDSSAVVSTPPASIALTTIGAFQDAFPGQAIPMSINVYDQFGYSIPATVTTNVPNSSIGNAILGSSGFFFSENGANNTTLTIHGREEEEVTVFFTELSTLVNTNITIRMLSCLQGFTYDESTMTCKCEQTLVEHNVVCDLGKMVLISPDKIWVGKITANASTQDLVISTCHLQYCEDGNKAFKPPYYDMQCRNLTYRSGVLCGGCLPGYSVVLGTRECRQCTNLSLLLIPLFGILGILLFVVIAFLEVTVEKGWMYSILFYSNIITLSPLSLSEGWHFILIPPYLLSFELGMRVCLYDGMANIDRVFLKLLFPFYLFILMIVVTLLSKKINISRHYSPVKTFVTLGIMSYTSILDTCVEIVTATTLRTASQETHLRWLSDPNVIYFRGWHCALVILASVIIVVYIIPVPLLLLCPPIAYKFKKLAPFLDALWAPFKPECRWWLGVRLALRAVLFFGTSFLASAGNIISGLILLIMLEIQHGLQPFKTRSVNVIDNVMIGDIMALILGLFFFETSGGKVTRTIYLVATIIFGYSLVFGILVYHLSVKWQLKKRLVNRWMLFKKSRCKNEVSNTTINLDTLACEEQTSTLHESLADPTSAPVVAKNLPTHTSFRLNVRENVMSLSQTRPAIADFSHFRESMLESHD